MADSYRVICSVIFFSSSCYAFMHDQYCGLPAAINQLFCEFNQLELRTWSSPCWWDWLISLRVSSLASLFMTATYQNDWCRYLSRWWYRTRRCRWFWSRRHQSNRRKWRLRRPPPPSTSAVFRDRWRPPTAPWPCSANCRGRRWSSKKVASCRAAALWSRTGSSWRWPIASVTWCRPASSSDSVKCSCQPAVKRWHHKRSPWRPSWVTPTLRKVPFSTTWPFWCCSGQWPLTNTSAPCAYRRHSRRRLVPASAWPAGGDRTVCKARNRQPASTRCPSASSKTHSASRRCSRLILANTSSCTRASCAPTLSKTWKLAWCDGFFYHFMPSHVLLC